MSKWFFTRRGPAALLALVLLAVLLVGQVAAQEGSSDAEAADDGLFPGGGQVPDPAPPTSTDNHTPGTSTPLTCGVATSDAISSPGQVDYFKIETGADWPVVITVDAAINGSPLDAVLNLYDDDGTTLLTDQDQFNGNDPRLHWTTSFNNPGGFGSLHYVRVHDYWGSGGASFTYTIRWEYARYISMTTAGTVDGVAYQPGDILTWKNCGNSTSWSMFFDASDVGISGNIRDFAVLNGSPAAAFRQGSLILAMPKQTIPGFGTLVAQDMALFQFGSTGTNTSGVFYRFFDGSDVGLTTSGEAIDGVAVFSSTLAVSTTGNAAVPGVSGADEDAMYISTSSLGTNTVGTWGVLFDSSDVGVPAANDLNAFWISPAGFFNATFLKNVTLGGILRKPSYATACDLGFFGATTSCTWGVSHQGLADADLVAINAVLDGYDEGSHWWPAGLAAVAADEAAPRSR